MNHKPATPLPWVDHAPDMPRNILRDDLAYARHASNAYPQLIRALRILAAATERQPNSLQFASERFTAHDLLRELGE